MVEETSQIEDCMCVLSFQDDLTDANAHIVKFLEEIANMLTVIKNSSCAYILRYISEFLASKRVKVERIDAKTLLELDEKPEKKIEFEKTLKLREELYESFVEMGLQNLLEDCFGMVYVIVIEELNQPLFSSQKEIIMNILVSLQYTLCTLNNCSFLDCSNVFMTLNTFLSVILYKYNEVQDEEYKDKYMQMQFILDIILLHKTCPKVHEVVYRDINIFLAKLAEKNALKCVLVVEKQIALVDCLKNYLQVSVQKRFCKITAREIIFSLKETIEKIRVKLPCYAQESVTNTLFLLNTYLMGQ